MPSAEIIAIGTELLLGEIADTNTRYAALFFRELGINLYRTTIVGDNIHRISKAIQESMDRADIILTSGGLGPTVDDPTRDAVAFALNRKTKFLPELWQQIEDRFSRFGRTATENNKKQAYIPNGAVPIENEVGTAPAFYLEADNTVIICLPGVPKELEHLLENKVKPLLYSSFKLNSRIKTKILRVAGVGESLLDSWISDLETAENPTVGLSAHPGQIDIRITAKAKNEEDADGLIDEMEQKIRKRLGIHIFGVNNQTIQDKVFELLKEKNLSLTLCTSGLSNKFTEQLKSTILLASKSVENSDDISYFTDIKKDDFNLIQTQNEIIFSITLKNGEKIQEIQLEIQTLAGTQREKRTYGGPPLLKEEWAVNQAFDYLRRYLQDIK